MHLGEASDLAVNSSTGSTDYHRELSTLNRHQGEVWHTACTGWHSAILARLNTWHVHVRPRLLEFIAIFFATVLWARLPHQYSKDCTCMHRQMHSINREHWSYYEPKSQGSQQEKINFRTKFLSKFQDNLSVSQGSKHRKSIHSVSMNQSCRTEHSTGYSAAVTNLKLV